MTLEELQILLERHGFKSANEACAWFWTQTGETVDGRKIKKYAQTYGCLSSWQSAFFTALFELVALKREVQK